MRTVPCWSGVVVVTGLLLSASAFCDTQTAQGGLDRTSTVTGLTGLIRVPNAFALRQEFARFSVTPPMGAGYESIGARSSWAATLGLLPRTEFAFSLGSQAVDYDLAGHAKVSLTDARGLRPALALGVTDVARNGPKGSTGFVVATWPVLGDGVALTLGGAFSGNAGLLAGIQCRLGPVVELQAEYDTERVNVGVAAALGDRAFARVANLSTGTTATVGYTVPLTYLAPRKLTPPGPAEASAAIVDVLDRVKKTLVASGLEDVQVAVTHLGDNVELSAAYDDRCYTVNQLDGLPDVLKTMAENAPANTSALVVKLRRRALVMAEYRVPLEAYRRFAAGETTGRELKEAADVTLLPVTSEMRGPQQETEVANSSFRHVDVVVSPGIRTVVGTETGAFKIGVLGRVEAVAPLGRGLQAQSRWVYPIGGELAGDDPRRWRNDRALISYAFSPKPRWLAQVIAGRFPHSTSGVVVEVLRPLGSRSLFHAVAGKAENDRLGKKLYWLAEYWHFVPQWRAQVRVLGGRFLSADTGIGIDLIRGFGAVEMAIGVRDTSTSRLVQLSLSVPLSPRRQPQSPSTVRIRLADYLDQQLRSIIEGVNYLYLEDITARELSLGPDMRDTLLNRYRLVPDSGWWPGQ